MINARALRRAAGAMLLVAGGILATSAWAETPMQTVVVEAAVMTKTVIGHSDLGAPMEQVTLTHRVSYADLDLATHSGALALEQRVKETARIACEQLDKLYPLEEKQAPECIREAIEKSSGQVQAAIAAAEHSSSEE